MTQKSDIIHHMRSAFITPLEALRLYGCYRFSARINEIRDNYDLKEMWTVTRKGKRIKAFKIKGIK